MNLPLHLGMLTLVVLGCLTAGRRAVTWVGELVHGVLAPFRVAGEELIKRAVRTFGLGRHTVLGISELSRQAGG